MGFPKHPQASGHETFVEISCSYTVHFVFLLDNSPKAWSYYWCLEVSESAPGMQSHALLSWEEKGRRVEQLFNLQTPFPIF